jgi:hypothetical protein
LAKDSYLGAIDYREQGTVRTALDSYTSGDTGLSTGSNKERTAQNSQQFSTRRDGRVVDGGGLENH